LVAIDFFLVYLVINKKSDFKFLISLLSFCLVLLPHFIWLIENNYTTITYALHRAEIENSNFFEAHLLNPLLFLGKQIGILIPFFIMIFFLFSKFKTKINLKDKKLIFLISINIAPIVLMFLTSIFLGAKIRTMWMTPFYLFSGVLILYIFQQKIIFNRLKNFLIMFLIFFVFSPMTYYYISITQADKRTDYPGKKISEIVQKNWESNFTNTIGLVGGDEWHGGNLSYHLKSRPVWDNILEKKIIAQPKNTEDGFILIGNADTLLKICNGAFFKIEAQGVCMIGIKK
jgi:hypothetical protein